MKKQILFASLLATAVLLAAPSAYAEEVSFSQNPINMGVGQIFTATVSGGTAFYVSSNTNPSIMTYLLNGGALSITGVKEGSAVVQICSITSVCANLSVNVGASSTTSSNASNSSDTTQGLTFSTMNPTVNVGQTTNVSLSGGSVYFISANPDSTIVQATVSGYTLQLTGVKPGSVSLIICGSSVGCKSLPVVVTGTAAVVTPAPIVTPTPVTPSPSSNTTLLQEIQTMRGQLAQILAAVEIMQTRLTQLASGYAATTSTGSSAISALNTDYAFTSFLSTDSIGSEVTALQKKLAAEGFYSGPITGTYGPLTEAAVKKYQTAHGIDPLGYVGPSTRAALNR